MLLEDRDFATIFFYGSSGIGIVPDISMLGDDTQCELLPTAADEKWRVGFLKGFGLAAGFLQLVITTLKSGRMLGEEFFDNFTSFAEAPDAFTGSIERDSHTAVLIFVPAR